MLRKVVFLDRDGVINRDSPDYIRSWAEFEFLPGSIDAIRRLSENGFTIFVITNQSAVNRGMVPLRDLEHMHTMMRQAVAAGGGEIRDIFFCPHTPDEGCACRKPLPGLIRMAQNAYQADLSDACMVGDKATDIQCARNAGCASTVLVRTGNHLAAEKILAENNIRPAHVADDLAAAADWIMKG